MKKLVILLLLAALLLSACGRDLEPWELPQVDAAPTPQPMAVPSYQPGSPVNYLWNEAVSFDMADPGVSGDRVEQELSHAESLALFPSGSLPEAIFTESHSKYAPLRLQKAKHSVLLDAEGALLENAYVEYHYLPKGKDEAKGLTVMAELCSHDTLLEISNLRCTPHIRFAQDSSPQFSSYYLDRFLLFRLGELRCAQALVLPDSYFSKLSSLESSLEDGQEPALPRQVLLSFRCGAEMSDEEFIAAVCAIWQYGPGADPLPPAETPRLPSVGEKGAA